MTLEIYTPIGVFSPFLQDKEKLAAARAHLALLPIDG